MKIGIFTTQTPHHLFFVKELRDKFDDLIVFCEGMPLDGMENSDKDTGFQALRNNYEYEKWFDAQKPVFSDLTKSYYFEELNSRSAISSVKNEALDVVIDFGTGLIGSELLAVCPKNIFNLHGGDPERYRGLDSHMWCIYHSDYSGLVTTLHKLETKFDTGDIVLQQLLPITAGLELHQLRSVNTVVCLELALATLSMIVDQNKVLSRPQRKAGRYYSSMPSVILSQVEKRFLLYTQRLSV